MRQQSLPAAICMKPVTLIDLEPLRATLANGELLLTPNQRLASRIRHAWAVDRAGAGAPVCDRPPVYALEQWIDQCWEALVLRADAEVLDLSVLNPQQEACLWESVVSESESGAALMRPAATARQLALAWRHLQQWQLDLQDSAVRARFNADENHAVVLAWMDSFELQCTERGWLPRAGRGRIIRQRLEAGELPAPQGPVATYGFDDIAPLYAALLENCGGWRRLDSEAPAGSVRVVGCADVTEELDAAALWAQRCLEDNPEARIGVVIPELAQQRQRVVRAFSRVFEPEAGRPGAPRRQPPMNLSAAEPLVAAPLIQAALDGIALCLPAIDRGTALRCLHSPFYCLDDGDSERIAALARAVCDTAAFEIRSAYLRQLAEQVSRRHGDPSQPWHFAEALLAQANIARERHWQRRLSLSQWVDSFVASLHALGWPGRRTLDSIEYQQLTQWRGALQQLLSLEQHLGPLPLHEALNKLRDVLTATAFQPQTPESPLQLLGSLEAAGLRFTHLWLASMSERQWPPAPSPNPLLPGDLQRLHGMPHADAGRELGFARALTRRFLHAADTIVVSYPARVDDNDTVVSRLFDDRPRESLQELLGAEVDELSPWRRRQREQRRGAKLEQWDDGAAPAVADQQSVRGGARILADQAACPFRAFARHRLHLREREQPRLGIDPRARGEIVHRALEYCWERLGNRDALLALSEAGRQTLCVESACFAIKAVTGNGADMAAPFSLVEQQRTSRLLMQWLALEQERAGFTVESMERREQFRFAGLDIRLRLDRVDRLSDGSIAVIDYKTGGVSLREWAGERPDNPQLPLYAVLLDELGENVGAIAYAQLRVGDCNWIAAGEENLAEPGFSWNRKTASTLQVEHWPQLKQHWRAVLSTLAGHFLSGEVTVDPKNGAATCRYCEMAPLCRVDQFLAAHEREGAEP